MLQPRIASSLRPLLLQKSSSCLECHRQAPRSPAVRNALPRPFTTAPALRKDEPQPEPEFVPRPLGRPIGFSNPPKPGRNSSSDEKLQGNTWKERNLENRKKLAASYQKSYFRDFTNIRKYRDGKTFMANPKLFRSDVSLFFPNFHGDTLEGKGRDTTDVLKGKVSVVNVFSSRWGEMNVDTFTSAKVNPELQELVQANKDVAQKVDVNVEENTMKAWIIALFEWQLRRKKNKEDWGKYFVVRKGVTDRIREAIGLLNGRVGYVYLVDQDCKIRWAGSGDAEGTEKDDLTKGFKRLIEDVRNPHKAKAKAKPQKPDVEEELEAQAVNAGAS